MMNRFETCFVAYYIYIVYYQTIPFFKKTTLGQFENLVFVIMSTRENIRLIAGTSLCITNTFKGRDSVVKPIGYFLYFFTCHHCLNILIYTFKMYGYVIVHLHDCPGRQS